MIQLSPFVLVIFLGGWSDRSGGAVEISMPSEQVCLREMQKIEQMKMPKFDGKTLFCVDRREQ